ncbi:MAG: hypothetical protein ACI4W6_10570 [Acutalibacteraceae bacterium]
MKNKKAQNFILICSGVLTLIICIVMNFVFIPEIESGTGDLRMFDMTFGYTYQQAQQFVSLLSPQGLDIYLRKQLPLDFIYPVVYSAFFVSVLLKLKVKNKGLLALPICLFISDYCENIFSIIMLTRSFSEVVSTFACAVTIFKTITMYLIIVLIIVLIILRLVKRKQSAKEH